MRLTERQLASGSGSGKGGGQCACGSLCGGEVGDEDVALKTAYSRS